MHKRQANVELIGKMYLPIDLGMEIKSDLNVPTVKYGLSRCMVVSEPKFVAENLGAHNFLIVTTRLMASILRLEREKALRKARERLDLSGDEHGVSQLSLKS
jgi:hypothetical protein